MDAVCLRLGSAAVLSGLNRLEPVWASGLTDPPTLEPLFAAAFRLAVDDRTLSVSTPRDDDLRMRIGIGAVLMHLESGGWDELTAEVHHSLRMIRALSAMLAGVPIDYKALGVEDGDALESLPLLAWYREAKAANS